MQYTYEFELFHGDECWVVAPFDMDGGTQGSTIEEVLAGRRKLSWRRSPAFVAKNHPI